MKKKILLYFLVILSIPCLAQVKQQIKANVSYMSLDLPDDMAFHYQVSYQREMYKRLVYNVQLGYCYLNGVSASFNSIQQQRQRISLDAGLLLNVIKLKKISFRVGGGVSIWHRKDNIANNIKFNTYPNKPEEVISFNIENRNKLDIGYHLLSEIEIPLQNRFILNARFGFADLRQGGISSSIGLGVGYIF